MPDYVYQTLPSSDYIRLLKVIPLADAGDAADTEALPVQLMSVPLDQAPMYECVSYAWISKHRGRRVLILDGSYVSTTESLLEALPYLVKACTSGYLWIDQLCINQDDIAERSSQVGQMGKIYRRAERLLVWLGPRTIDSSLLLALQAELPERGNWSVPYSVRGGCCNQSEDNSHIWKFFKRQAAKLYPAPIPFERETGSGVRGVKRVENLDIEGAEGDPTIVLTAICYRNAILRVFDLPWFGRAWVLQEAILAKSFVFMIGEGLCEPVRLERLERVFLRARLWPQSKVRDSADLVAAGHIPYTRKVVTPPGRGRGFFKHVLGMSAKERRFESGGKEQHSLSGFLQEIRRGCLQGCCNASDPRDILFSLWDYYKLPESLKPDYTLSTSVVFQRATLACIEEKGDLSVLTMACGVGRRPHDGLGLPSWTSDWTRPTLQWGSTARYNSNACRHYQHHPTTDAKDGELFVKGRAVHRLLHVSRIPLEAASGELLGLACVDDIRADSVYFGPLIPDDVTEKFVSVCTDPSSFSWRNARSKDEVVDLDIYKVQRESMLASRFRPANVTIDQDAADDHTHVMHDPYGEYVCPGRPGYSFTVMSPDPLLTSFRRLGLTEGGHKCFVYPTAQAGDVVAVLHGAHTPVVLRAVSTARYCFVGEAYVDGMMYGEAVEWAEEDAEDLILI